jgi:hypothetical protein
MPKSFPESQRRREKNIRSSNSKSFTLLEVILAITVLTLAVGGSFILISQTIASVSVVQSKLIASYLAQEGIEVVKNIRDTNWLKIQPWDQSLEEGDYEVDYDDFSLTECSSPCDYGHDYNLHFLKIPDQGFYNYDLGDPTIFKRKITISDKVDLDDPPDGEMDKLKVSVEVLWKEKGKIHSITSIEYLYNWTKYE